LLAVVKAVMNCRVALNAENFLNSWGTVNISGKTLLLTASELFVYWFSQTLQHAVHCWQFIEDSLSASHLYVARASESRYTPEFQIFVLPSIVCTPLNIVQNSRDGSWRQQCSVTNSWNVLYLAGDDKRLNYAENWITNGTVNRVFVFWGGGLMIDDWWYRVVCFF
jgi:hypothetical protein